MSWDKSERNKKALFREIALDDNIELETEIIEDNIHIHSVDRSDVKGSLERQSLRRSRTTGSSRAPLPKPQNLNLRPSASFGGHSPKASLPTEQRISHLEQAGPTAEISKSRSAKPTKVTNRHSKAMPPLRGTKRKREKPVKMQPESRQFLKGLHFFYVREQNLGPRAFQIQKAKEFGAVREEEWTDEVTHIVADRELSHEDVIKYMTENVIDPFPEQIPIVCHDEFVVDCINFGRHMNAQLPHYRRPGYKAYMKSKVPKDTTVDKITEVGKALEHPEPDNVTERLRCVSPELEPSSLVLSSVPLLEQEFDDELDQVIAEAKAMKDLPLDLDEDEADDTPSEASGDESEEEQRPKSRSKSVSFQKSGQANFACMSKSDGSEGKNPNSHVINTLQEMSDIYVRLNDQWRSIAYRKAITQLKQQTDKITTKKQARKLPSIGDRLADKIQEIATTNRLRRLESAMLDPDLKALQTFLGIYGVGSNQAHKWVEQGYRTLSDLTTHQVPLTTNQKVGLEHYEDFATQIPRSEMSAHDSFVRRFASKIDKGLEFTIGGSYRRGQDSSGDIDFIVTKAGADAGTIAAIMLDRVIPLLFKADYLKVGLSTGSHHSNGETGSKWHGACALPLPKPSEGGEGGARPWRRIDFLFTPHDCIGAALLYFTGNDIFNRSMRLLASKKKMRLNQRGLYKDVIRGHGRKRLTEGLKVEGFDERKIFEALGVPWREPGERRC